MVAVLAQTDGGQTFDLGVSIIVFFAAIGLFTLMVASVWRVFTDMGGSDSYPFSAITECCSAPVRTTQRS